MKILMTILLLCCFAEVGAKVVRVPISWSQMEPNEKGKVDPRFWLRVDAILLATEKAKMLTIFVFSDTPCWATSDPRKLCATSDFPILKRFPPADPNDYGNAAAVLAKRYRGRIMALELWDEPNLIWLPLASRVGAINDNSSLFVDLQGAEQYAKLVKAAYPKIKLADPNVTVVAGSIAAADLDYVNVMYDNGVKGNFDALSFHPFTDVYPVGRDNIRYGISYSPSECPEGASLFWCFRNGVERIRRTMVEEQEDPKPIWFTQFGFRSTVAGNWARTTGHETYLREAFRLINSWDYVRVACWSNLVDTTDSNSHETRFGLYDSQLKIKFVGERFREIVTNITTAYDTNMTTAPRRRD